MRPAARPEAITALRAGRAWWAFLMDILESTGRDLNATSPRRRADHPHDESWRP